jgi:formate hydrogenlyase transcriptional activator
LDLLQSYDWPGNVRELQNVIERAVILYEKAPFVIDPTWFKTDPRKPSNPSGSAFSSVVEKEKEIIESALRETQGRISGPGGAAAKLGIPRQTLESKIRALGIDKSRFRTIYR